MGRVRSCSFFFAALLMVCVSDSALLAGMARVNVTFDVKAVHQQRSVQTYATGKKISEPSGLVVYLTGCDERYKPVVRWSGEASLLRAQLCLSCAKDVPPGGTGEIRISFEIDSEIPRVRSIRIVGQDKSLYPPWRIERGGPQLTIKTLDATDWREGPRTTVFKADVNPAHRNGPVFRTLEPRLSGEAGARVTEIRVRAGGFEEFVLNNIQVDFHTRY